MVDGAPAYATSRVAPDHQEDPNGLRFPRPNGRAARRRRSQENYQIREIADMVLAVVPGSRVTYAPGGAPDPRCYRVNCDELARTLPSFQPRWTVRDGVSELYEAYRREELAYDSFAGPGSRYLRIAQLQRLKSNGLLDDELRWTARPAAVESVGEPMMAAAARRRGAAWKMVLLCGS